VDGQPGQRFYWNLWCLARDLTGGPAGVQPYRFRGQLGIDLDVHVLAPRQPRFETERWGWKQEIYVWRRFEEDQVLLRLTKDGSTEEFFTLLWPRAAAEASARVTSLAGGAGVRVAHREGTDFVLLRPGQSAAFAEEGARLSAEVGLVRLSPGSARLVLVKGESASARGWTLRGTGPVSLEVGDGKARGETSGSAQELQIAFPSHLAPKVLLDGSPARVKAAAGTLRLAVGAGYHTFRLDTHK
jgi:hypothetical protein